MKLTQKLIRNTLLAATATISVSAAEAGSLPISKEMMSRPDLSLFQDALERTGVIEQLNSGVAYTIFAPSNEAMKSISPFLSNGAGECVENKQCNDALVEILRNHIIPNEVGFNEPGKFMAYSIDGDSVSLSQPRKGDYYVNGAKVETQYQMGGGILYKIDKVIASAQEKLDFQTYINASHDDYYQTNAVASGALLSNDLPRGGIAVETHTPVVTQKTYYDERGLVDTRITTVKPTYIVR